MLIFSFIIIFFRHRFW